MNLLDLCRRGVREDESCPGSSAAFCSVNGRASAPPPRAGMALIDWLRQAHHARAVHRGCDTGHCGSCAVMLDGAPVKSCAVMAGDVHGQQVVTADALAAQGSMAAGALLREMRKPGVFQCGYCAGAFVLAAAELLAREPDPSEKQVREAFDGLLCRCTGYQRIVDAVLDAAAALRQPVATATNAALQHPANLAEARVACEALPDATWVAGGQQLAREARGLEAEGPWISLRRVAELRGIELRDGRTLAIGAACTHREIAQAPLVAAHLPALAELAAGIGDAFMRNRGTVGGALFDIAPGSSYPGAWLALGATIATTHRDINIQSWCDAPGSRLALAPDEIVREVRFALPERALHQTHRPVPARIGLVSLFAARYDGRWRVGICGQSHVAYLGVRAAQWLDGTDAGSAPRWERAPFTDARADARYRDAIAQELLRRMRRELDTPTPEPT
ncbi:FAD binding domain-containing protein [Variovorax sp. OV329]|uniref:FAD binding domain-containing protein n=1 Tax=Variovorax sp. OV329 TaxID=1882825 RepID=UPI0008E1DFF2|nr:FAD binding domain-containing protein [Variovorax sp. OV329]SFM93845.1 Xanthine dehydrogenase, iron-sulfur cluster and FAD-binding subunit A [Variovorax sp. OV329]